MSLDTLIQPCRQDTFFGEVWERNAFHIARNDPTYFSFLREDLPMEQIIWQTCPNWGDVSLARSKTSYESAPYAAMPPSVSTIRKALADDYTIVINNLEKKSVRVAEFCRDVEKDLYFNSIVNLYYTKANSQGLDYHYDTEDVFILQLEGRKEWRIYERRADLPLDDSAYEQPDCDSSSFEEYDLGPGDVLYIPRGVVHEARTRDFHSVHLTLTVSVVRWASILQQLVYTVAQSDVEFRKAVPIEILKTNDIALAQATVSAFLSKMGDKKHLATTISQLQDQLLVKSRLPATAGVDRIVADETGLESEVGIAPDQMYVISESLDGLLLKFIGASVEVSDGLEEAVKFICQRKTFFVHELPATLTPTEKLGLVRRLIHCEFLTVRP